MAKNKKVKKNKHRNLGVLAIIERGSGGPMKDRKKEKDRRVCREKVSEE